MDIQSASMPIEIPFQYSVVYEYNKCQFNHPKHTNLKNDRKIK